MAKTLSPNRITKLEHEMTVLRSFVIGLAGKDEEGNYRPEFVERILLATQEEVAGKFAGSKSFIDQLQ